MDASNGKPAMTNPTETHHVVDAETLKIVRTFHNGNCERVAKAWVTKRMKKDQAKYAEKPTKWNEPREYQVMSASRYKIQAPSTKMVRNMMTGNMVEIDFNAPLSCDPSSETYWSC